MAYLENTYAQMKHMNVTARQMQEVGVGMGWGCLGVCVCVWVCVGV